ncbi:bifunctional diguanylate cyclase/phosphodiesterase [Pelomonas sp. KK5]|uniref:sensor domain-containing protein n=1 Tax=Pelomonas sp. KK5 TaxID=1855730 RepID=UPI00097C860A|nr:PAS domain S-box protein [Pelomonas sp. KK5]
MQTARSPSAARAAALALVGLALFLLLGSLLPWQALGLRQPIRPTVGLLNPLGLIGLALCLVGAAGRSSETPAPRAERVVVLLLFALPALQLLQTLSGLNLGVDLQNPLLPHRDPQPGAGRISPNAAVAYMLSATALWQLGRPRARRRTRLYLAATAAVALIGLAGLAGYFLGLETLYRLPRFNRMLPPTAAAFVVTAFGLWSLHEAGERFDPREAPRRIRRRTRAVVLLLTLTAGVAGFGLMRDTVEDQIAKDLEREAADSALALDQALGASLEFPALLSYGLPLATQFEHLQREPADGAARAALQAAAEGFGRAGLSSVVLLDNEGRTLAATGRALRGSAELEQPLAVTGDAGDAVLAWDGQHYLMLRELAVKDTAGRPVGRLRSEQPLPQVERLLLQLRQRDATSDAVICSTLSPAEAACAATRWRKPSFRLPLVAGKGLAAEAILRGLRGERGSLYARDPRGEEVVAAYAPIGSRGLALGLKTDVDTLYEPLRTRIAAFVAAMALVSALAIFALRKQVQPLLERLADSERELKAILDDQQELISLSRADGTLTYVNPSYAREWGLTPPQMVGANLYDHVDAPDRERVRQHAAQVFATGVPHRIENRMLTGDGRSRWLAWTNSLQTSHDGEVLLHSVGRDVTERRAAEQALRHLTDVIDATSDYVLQTDHEGRIHYMNPAARAVLGLAPDESLEGRLFSEFNTPETNEQLSQVILPHANQHGLWLGETAFRTHDGRIIPVSHMVIAHRDEPGRTTRYSGIMRNIAGERAVQREQQRQAATLRSITEAIPASVGVVGTDGRLRFANRRFAEWAGFTPEAALGRPIEELLGPEHGPASRPWIARALAGEGVSFLRQDRRGGQTRHMAVSYIPLSTATGELDGFVGVTQDVTRQKEEEIRLIRLSQRDPLTDALNRAGFEQFLEAIGQDAPTPVALLYVDLDHFKPVNDRHGHAVGDQVLRQFATRMAATVRPSDAVARLGGDEFAVALVGVSDIGQARAVADKILHAASQPFEIGALALQVGASIGIATGGAADWRGLVELADGRLYEAKARGRGRHA